MGTPEPSVRLQPRRPPGRADRKAGAHNSEIRRLRFEGYTYVAIQEALEDIGVVASICALRREVQRRPAEAAIVAPANRPRAIGTTSVQAVAAPSPVASEPLPARATGREIAEAYFKANPSNPLLRTREHA